MNTQSINIAKQKVLGYKGMVFFIALMNMFIPLSTDLYLPALPSMSEYFQVSATVTNLSLVSFFFCYAVGTLFWGPMSDKYGRKPVLVAGTAIYVVASVGCAVAPTAYILIAARVFEGFGAGAITAVSMAIIKDCFAGKQRETILAIVQSMSGLAPMLAPVIGAIIIEYVGWRGSFWLLVIIGSICLGMAAVYQETLQEDEKYTGSILGSLGRLVTVSKNIGFILPCIIFSMYSIAFMGYIAISSYIYIDYFGLSSQMYSYFFAANACLSLVGPMTYVKFFAGSNKKTFAMLCLSGCVLAGLLVFTVGRVSPIFFWLGFAPFSFIGTLLRPFSTSLLLDQQKGDTGSASSLINGVNTIFGSIGMTVASMAWSNIVGGLGMMIIFSSLLGLVAWLLLLRSDIPCYGVK